MYLFAQSMDGVVTYTTGKSSFLYIEFFFSLQLSIMFHKMDETNYLINGELY